MATDCMHSMAADCGMCRWAHALLIHANMTSEIRISDIGELTDLPILENYNDLPILAIRISDIGKLDDFTIYR